MSAVSETVYNVNCYNDSVMTSLDGKYFKGAKAMQAFRQTFKTFRQLRLLGLIVVIIGAAMTTTVRAQDYGGAALLIFNADSVTCDTGMEFTGAIVNTYEQVLGFRFIASVGGTVYADQLVFNDTPYGEGSFTGSIILTYENSGGTATVAPPLPSGQPVNLTLQVLAENVTPIWETRFTVSDCDGGVISQFPVSGEIDNLIQNIGFEQAGETEKLPAKWESKVDNDKRLCNDGLIVAAHSRNCAYQFKANPSVKAKIQQVSLLDPVGLLGDRIDLGAWIKADTLSEGSQVKVVIKYPTQPKAKVTLEIPPGSYEYTFVRVPSVNLPETPTKVKVTIQSTGEGSFVIDDVLAQRVINGAPQLSSGLVPLPGGSGASSLNGGDLTRPQ
jgi:hypothetical protein